MPFSNPLVYANPNVVFTDMTVMPVEQASLYFDDNNAPAFVQVRLADQSWQTINWSRIHCIGTSPS